jgi:hypothetical protein
VRDDRERLEDILEAMARIAKYASRGRTALYEDELLETWVVHHPVALPPWARSSVG